MSKVSEDLLTRFAARFAGLTRAHGQYSVGAMLKPDKKDPNKLTGPRGSRNEPVTLNHYKQHLEGSIGLGIVPIRDDATVVFAAIDIDVYDGLDLVQLQLQIIKLKLPLTVVRTKSGGAHLYLFGKEPLPAEVVRNKMLEWLSLLGLHPDTEIFPKQNNLAELDSGNWINIPYQDYANTTRYAIKPDGTPVSLKEFLDRADLAAITQSELFTQNTPSLNDGDIDWVEAPPCLQHLAQQPHGFDGHRNNSLFNIGVYVNRRYGDESYKTEIQRYGKYLHPALDIKEFSKTANSAVKKGYNYKCKDAPIRAHCNRALCVTRRFGVATGGGELGVDLGQVTKLLTDPPTYIWTINGTRIEMAAEDMVDQRRFGLIVLKKLDIQTKPLKAVAWSNIINDKLKTIEHVEVPKDATKEGQLDRHLQDFCTSRVQGKSIDELLLGKPVTENARTFFRSTDFLTYLNQHRVSGIDEKDLWTWLRRQGADSHSKTLKGKKTSYWSVPEFEKQNEEFAVPRKPAGDAM